MYSQLILQIGRGAAGIPLKSGDISSKVLPRKARGPILRAPFQFSWDQQRQKALSAAH